MPPRRKTVVIGAIATGSGGGLGNLSLNSSAVTRAGTPRRDRDQASPHTTTTNTNTSASASVSGKNSIMATVAMNYTVGEKVLCFHGPLLYEAKILKAEVFNGENTRNGGEGPHFEVHYKGWKQTWDEWVPPDRLRKFDEESIALQKRLIEQAKQQNASTSSSTKAQKTSSAAIGRTSTAGGRKEGARGTKRGRDDDDGARRPDMKIVMPDILKVQLVDDWENITKNSQLIPLPRSPTVVELLQEYMEWAKVQKDPLPKADTLLPTIVSGLKLYFDRALGTNLLYRFERPQYRDQRQKYVTGQNVVIGEQKEMSEVYGAEHLLRMLVSMPAMVAQSKMDPESVGILKDYIHELLRFMVQERNRIFLKEYETPPSGYINTITRS